MSLNRVIKLFFVIFLYSLIPLFAYGGETTGLTFLRIGVGSRESSLGGAVTSLTRGPSAIYWNPAGLYFSRKREFTFSYTSWLIDIKTHSIGYSFKNKIGVFGLSFYSSGIKGIQIRTIPGIEPEGETSSHNIMAGCSYARVLKNHLIFGATLKLLYEKIYIDSASGFGADFGIQYVPSKEGILIGATIQNIGRMGKFRSEKSKMPAKIKLGIGYKKTFLNKKLSVLIDQDYEFNFDYKDYFLSGIETGFKDIIVLRVGYIFKHSTRNFSVGTGFKWKNYIFDYAMIPFSNGLGDTHQFTFNLIF
ncbi:hypothetical protein DRQ09_01480 [candidate division KSB1 bacterium]|nr:MAG: hypothetical protein DRQ09_01480 [candidate division KSB1 bacterium]